MDLRFYRKELVAMTTANDELREALEAAGIDVPKHATPAEIVRLAAENVRKPQAQTIGVGDSPRTREQRLEDLRAAAEDQGVGSPTQDVVEALDLVRHPAGPRFVTRKRAEAITAEQQKPNAA